ncbi:MAG: hypothetical protein KDJ80_09855 [Nitratireductor sp.]|nr:hypothetical protein [Nitratireductor sp.]
MKLLYENRMFFGGLLTIEEPHLIARYNAALKGFGLKPVKLNKFQIDMTGFSPEVADELDDPEYLDPNGVNRRFIILTPEQAELPVVHTQFSNTEELMLEFFDKNRREIFALTIKDVIFGEIEENVLRVDNLDDLLRIDQVEFKLSTASDLLGKAHELQGMIDRLQKDPDAWQDRALLQSMVETAKVTGDIRANELLPKEVVFRHHAFWTSHFGGVYIFNDDRQVTVIADPATKGFRRSRPWEVAYIDINDHAQVYRFLLESGRIEPPRGAWVEQSGLLEKRAHMLVIGMIAEREPDTEFDDLTDQMLDSWVRKNARMIERDGALPLLEFVVKRTRDWSAIDMQEVRPEHRFLISRANPKHADWWLTNRLISEYLRFDFLTLFVFNKQGFYRAYQDWPEEYREYVVETVRDTYLKDKRALRARFYG